MPNFRKKGYATVLDIGDSSIRCLIVTKTGNKFELLGYGVTQSEGFSKGIVTQIDRAVQSVSHAVSMAEKRAQLHISSVIVNLSSYKMNSRLIGSEQEFHEDRIITEQLIHRVTEKTLQQVDHYDEDVILQMPLAYYINKEDVGPDPRGQIGHLLGIRLHILSVPRNHMQNLETVFSRCKWDIDLIGATPYMSALACLTEDEKQVGATLLDIGSDTISMAIFSNGLLVKSLVFPFGSNLITQDIAKTLQTPMDCAEKLKIKQGAAFVIDKDKNEKLQISVVGDENETENYSITKAYLNSIIESRLNEMLGNIQQVLNSLSTYPESVKRIVLTGGGSQLVGLREKVAHGLNAHVRISKPTFKGLPEYMDASEATLVGLLKYIDKKETDLLKHKKKRFFGKDCKWLPSWILQNL